MTAGLTCEVGSPGRVWPWLAGAIATALSIVFLANSAIDPGAPAALRLSVLAATGLLALRLGLRGWKAVLAGLVAGRTGMAISSGAGEDDVVIAVPIILRGPCDLPPLRDAVRRMVADRRYDSTPVVYLLDLGDAPTEVAYGDDVVLAEVSTLFQSLQMASPAGAIGYLFRPRTFNAAEGVWMGWERKRGKVMEFLRLARGETPGAFSGSFVVGSRCRYVFVADADTIVPPTCIPRLRAAAEHYRGSEGRPAIYGPSIECAPGGEPTLFQRLRTAGLYAGVRAFRLASDNQLAFGRDLFFGKGLIDVERFLDLVPDTIPENRLLSHDHYEAMLGGAIHIGSAAISEGCPRSPEAWERRLHRWVRGDFQAFALMASRPPAFWGLCQALETLLGHLSPIIVVAGVVAAIASESAPAILPLVWLAFLASSPGLLLLPLDLWVLSRATKAETARDLRRALANHVFGALLSSVVDFVFLYRTFRTTVSAIVQTVWRYAVSHRGFLAWDDYDADLGRTPRLAETAFWTVMLAVVASVHPSVLPQALVFGTLWLATPVLVSTVGRGARPHRRSRQEFVFSSGNLSARELVE